MDPSRPLFQRQDFISSIYFCLSFSAPASPAGLPPALAGRPQPPRLLKPAPLRALLLRIPGLFIWGPGEGDVGGEGGENFSFLKRPLSFVCLLGAALY